MADKIRNKKGVLQLLRTPFQNTKTKLTNSIYISDL